MKEAYVKFDTAKLLKEKGFPQNTSICNVVYKPNGKMSFNAKSFINPYYLFKDWYVFAPTQQMACCWLRDKQIDILPDCSLVDRKYSFHIINRYKSGGEIIHSDEMYDKYENAVEAALEYCLTNLI